MKTAPRPGAPYDFMRGPPHYAEVLARLRRDLPGSALTPEQVMHFFAGYGAESATAPDLAAGLLGVVQRGANGERPAVSLRKCLTVAPRRYLS